MNYLAQHFWNHDTNSIDGLKLWNALQPHIEKGELVVNIGQGVREGLKLVTYSKTYQYEHNSVAWDPLVQHCRGIIFDASDTLSPYRIVALPFSKFFNYGEGGIHYPSEGAEIGQVWTKYDGSLFIIFYWHGKWHGTTRGSLNSDIGEVGQQILDEYLNSGTKLYYDYTYMAELIYKENQIVVNYGDDRKLVLLGARCRNEGDYYSPHMFASDHFRGLFDAGNIECAMRWKFNSQEDMLKWLNATKGTEFEGFVVHFSDGSIFKFKSEDYMRLHRIIAQFTFKRVLEAVQLNEDEEIRKALPEELLPEFDRYKLMIDDKVCQIVTKVDKVVYNAPKDTRKEFALYLQQYHKGSDAMKYAFKYLDLDMDAFKLSDHVLQSLTKDDFEVEESKEKEYN
jgi:T4 RnlA family RNA ligase